MKLLHRRDFDSFVKLLMSYHFELDIKSSLFDEQSEECEIISISHVEFRPASKSQAGGLV
ncbi:hypothetical protein bsdtb5_25090 [Anaeromicropila herbilytica]|uniref:Uncharacterized protein n=1 Tax=Anaeromicropila herbilytica TaxID=2785025 RepID=A0A7R7EM06_9FIRM|nr:hypothetical protein bsdtb5_25090 [Anaeromicropila herbilytica]